MSPSYLSSWEINPTKKPDLSFDDWHEGFSDSDNRVFPKHLGNRAYMMGWLQSLGMTAGYAGLNCIVSEESYREGWNQADFERNC